MQQQTLLTYLNDENRQLITALTDRYRLTFQEVRQLAEITRDLEMWGADSLAELFPQPKEGARVDKAEKKQRLKQLHAHWDALRQRPNKYTESTPAFSIKATAITREKEKLGLGYCPVASPKTRCCNLLTLDAVENCGYGCSYCSIQSFYSDNEVYFDSRFAEKLAQLEIDPDKLYHIGTGQSSDSLMWGNSHGVLDALIAFAQRHPNVILELKTKSANIHHLLRVDFPKNIICTWSLNTPPIIANEELGSASLEERLAAARSIADKGHVIGFHFHPIVHYDQWREDYGAVFQQLQQMFTPHEVALVSLGTLTYIKPVMKQIRERGGSSQILKMPLVEAEGKLSYPDTVKLDLFSHAFNSFSEQWRNQVFFYLCMENQRFWKPVFGYEYDNNEAFEQAMKQSYLAKIERQQHSE
ncbi:MAG: hypothetical protein MI754_03920 [Chromatiales bacterium]|nr:hypothetical protein [Chromatiales bacterium]